MKKAYKYTPDQVQFLANYGPNYTVSETTTLFNDAFNTHLTTEQIRNFVKKHKITFKRSFNNFTPEQRQFVLENYASRSSAEMSTLFNETFGTDRKQEHIKSLAGHLGIHNGRPFNGVGRSPWNAGTKGLSTGPKGPFRKDYVPPHAKPLWAERIHPTGYIEMKVPDPDQPRGWRNVYKQKYVWEKVHGPVPPGMVVMFKDSNRLNCEIDNLMLVSHVVQLQLCKNDYRQTPNELKPCLLALSKLEVVAFARSKSLQENANRS
jgi:hypothetical protein